MSLVIEQDDRVIDLTIPKFSVDSALGNVPEPLPAQHMFAAFIGPPRSGKTSLSTAMLSQTKPKIYAGVFDHVHLAVPMTSFLSMDDSPFAKHDPAKIHHELTVDMLTQFIETLQARSQRKQNTLLIIDDFMAELKNAPLRKSLERLVCNRRHLRVSLWVITQTYRSIPLSTRKLLSHVFMFRSNNMREVESLREELVPRDRHEFAMLYNHVFPPGGDVHNFLFIDVSSGELYNRFSLMKVTRPSK